MTEAEAYVAFNLLPDVGAVTVARLAAACGGVVAAWEQRRNKLDWQGQPAAWERECARAEKMKVTLVTLADSTYPARLREIASPPLVLYVVGDVSALDKSAIALVGTRHPTLYGRETAEKLASGLAQAGWAVYSGLALGIDAAAHRGALAAKGVTVGVLGGALDKFYPKDNAALAREIADRGGAVVSEFPFGRAPDPQTFPQRNRVVSGLSRGVVAVEAPLQSGTLITCRLAGEQGRAVMAVPGRIDVPNARGCLYLIREGARLVTCVEDIIEEVTPLGELSRPPAARRGGARKASAGKGASRPDPPSAAAEAQITLEEAMVLRAIPEGGATIDDVARAAQLPAVKVNALLVQLRLKRRARFMPGNRVIAL